MGFLKKAKAVKASAFVKSSVHSSFSSSSSVSSSLASSSPKASQQQRSKNKRKTPQAVVDELVVGQIIAVLEGNLGEKIQEKDLRRIWKKVKQALHVKTQTRKRSQKKTTDQPTDKALNQEEIIKILSTAQQTGIKKQVLAELFFELGLKLAEITALRIEDLDQVKKTITVGNHTVKLNDELFQKILNIVQGRKNGYIFSDGKKPMTTSTLLRLLESLMEKAGVQKRKHLESAVDQFLRSLHEQGKPFLYWEHQDYIIQLRNQAIQKKFMKGQKQ